MLDDAVRAADMPLGNRSRAGGRTTPLGEAFQLGKRAVRTNRLVTDQGERKSGVERHLLAPYFHPYVLLRRHRQHACTK